MNEKQKKCIYILSFIFVTLLKCSVYFTDNNIALLSDHIGDFATPSYLAGLNWLDTIATTGYYGYGFKWIYFLLFKFIKNPYVISYAITTIGIILIGAVSILICHVLINYFKIDSTVIVVCLSVIIASTGSIGMNSEFSIYASFWRVVWIVCKMISISDTKKQIKYSIFIALWLCYMRTLHERNMAVIISFFIVAIMYHILFRKKLISYIPFIMTFAIGHFFERSLTAKVQHFFWGSRLQNGTLPNTKAVGSASKYLTILREPERLKAVFDCMVSNFMTLSFKTYGIAFVGIAIVLIGLVYYFKRGKNSEISGNEKTRFTIVLLSAITILIVIAGLGTSWGIQAYEGNTYGYKGYSYYRYFYPYVGVAMASTIAVVYHKTFSRKVLSITTFILTAIIACYFFFGVFTNVYYEYMREDFVRLERMCMDIFYVYTGPFGVAINVVISSIVAFLICFLILYRKDCDTLKLAIYSCLVIIIVPVACELKWPSADCTLAGATYELFDKMQEEELPKEIYAETSVYTYQFMLNRYTILVEEPVEEMENTIRVSNNSDNLEVLNSQGYRCSQLDENEYIYVKGKKLQQVFEKYGTKWME